MFQRISQKIEDITFTGFWSTIGAKMITCRKIVLNNSFLNYIALPYICYRLPGLISGCNVMVSLSCARKGEPQGNLFTLSGIFKQGGPEGGGCRMRVRSTMYARPVRRDTVPSRKCDYPPLLRGVSNCAQHLRDGTVSVRRGQSAIVPSSAEARDCRSPG